MVEWRAALLDRIIILRAAWAVDWEFSWIYLAPLASSGCPWEDCGALGFLLGWPWALFGLLSYALGALWRPSGLPGGRLGDPLGLVGGSEGN